jgi:hypothetical protein
MFALTKAPNDDPFSCGEAARNETGLADASLTYTSPYSIKSFRKPQEQALQACYARS